MKNRLIIVLLLISSLTGLAQVKQPPAASYESPLFRNIDGTYFDLEHDNSTLSANSYFNILDWLQGRVAGLQVYTIRGIRIPFIRNYPATVYVDEIRTDASILNMLPVADMALIKIIKSSNAAIASGPGGAIVVYTKRGEEGEEEEMENDSDR
jgi:hypothetical protein